MSILLDVSIEILKKMPENSTIEDIVEEIYIIGDILEETPKEGRKMTIEELRNLVLPEEEISEEERQEIRMIKKEMESGKERRYEDVSAELNV